MAAKDFQELIKAQQETTKALMSAEDAAKYDTILTEKQFEFDKKSEAAKQGAETKRVRKAESDRQQAATEVVKATTEKTKTDGKLIKQSGDAVVVELEKARAEQKEAKKLAGGAFKSDKKYQVATQKVNDLEMTRATEGKEGASLLQAQVAIMGNQLGEFAEYNKEYNDKKLEADMAANRELRNEATDPAKQKELDDDLLKLQEKQGGLLGLIASGMIGLRKDFNIADKLKSAGTGIMNLLKTSLVAGFALAMVAFLNSEYWEDTKNVIVEDIFPQLMEFFGFLKDVKRCSYRCGFC
jgi:hypothetical protein